MSRLVSQYCFAIEGRVARLSHPSLMLYTQVEVDIEGYPIENIWLEAKGIILAVNV